MLWLPSLTPFQTLRGWPDAQHDLGPALCPAVRYSTPTGVSGSFAAGSVAYVACIYGPHVRSRVCRNFDTETTMCPSGWSYFAEGNEFGTS